MPICRGVVELIRDFPESVSYFPMSVEQRTHWECVNHLGYCVLWYSRQKGSYRESQLDGDRACPDSFKPVKRVGSSTAFSMAHTGPLALGSSIHCMTHWSSCRQCPLRSKQHNVVAEYTAATSRTVRTAGTRWRAYTPQSPVAFCSPDYGVESLSWPIPMKRIPLHCSGGLSDPVQTAKQVKTYLLSWRELLSGWDAGRAHQLR